MINIPTGVVGHLYLLIVIYRFALGCVELICYNIFRQIEASEHRKCTAKRPSVAIVCATVSSGQTLKNVVPTWLRNKPNEILIVTNPDAHASVKRSIAAIEGGNIRVLQCLRTNKRAQLCEGFKHTESDIIIICDDDTVWSPGVLARLVEPFSNPRIGAVFPEVKFRPAGRDFNFWEILSGSRLSGDAIDIRTSMLIDGGVFCASGTTAAYRGRFLRDEEFVEQFPTETWMGKVLNAGDDQSLTLWLCKRDLECRVIPYEGSTGCGVLTTPRTTWRHLGQLVRWSRSDWQACINATLLSTAVWRNHPFTAWTRLTWCTGTFTFLVEAYHIFSHWQTSSLAAQLLVLQASRLIRFSPDFVNHPKRLLYLPIIALYVYICQIIRVYSLITIGNTAWS